MTITKSKKKNVFDVNERCQAWWRASRASRKGTGTLLTLMRVLEETIEAKFPYINAAIEQHRVIINKWITNTYLWGDLKLLLMDKDPDLITKDGRANEQDIERSAVILAESIILRAIAAAHVLTGNVAKWNALVDGDREFRNYFISMLLIGRGYRDLIGSVTFSFSHKPCLHCGRLETRVSYLYDEDYAVVCDRCIENAASAVIRAVSTGKLYLTTEQGSFSDGNTSRKEAHLWASGVSIIDIPTMHNSLVPLIAPNGVLRENLASNEAINRIREAINSIGERIPYTANMSRNYSRRNAAAFRSHFREFMNSDGSFYPRNDVGRVTATAPVPDSNNVPRWESYEVTERSSQELFTIEGITVWVSISQAQAIGFGDGGGTGSSRGVIGGYHSGNGRRFVATEDAKFKREFTTGEYVGYEWEMEFGVNIDTEQAASAVFQLFNTQAKKHKLHESPKYVVIERDGSLQHGFEMISGYAPVKTHRSVLRFAGLNPHAMPPLKENVTAGVHVHVSAKSVGFFNALKIVYFISNPANKSLISNIAGRYDTTYANITKYFQDIKNIYKLQRDYHRLDSPSNWKSMLSNNQGGRHSAVNFQHSGTIEFRIFRGFTNPADIIAALEFVTTLIAFARGTATRDMTTENYLRFVYRDMQSESRFLRNRLVRVGVRVPKEITSQAPAKEKISKEQPFVRGALPFSAQ